MRGAARRRTSKKPARENGSAAVRRLRANALRDRPESAADSASEPAIESDAGERAADEHHDVEPDLPMRVDERHHEERTEAPAERGNRKLERFARRTSRAAVVFGQMPLTTRTGGHVCCSVRNIA